MKCLGNVLTNKPPSLTVYLQITIYIVHIITFTYYMVYMYISRYITVGIDNRAYPKYKYYFVTSYDDYGYYLLFLY